MFCTECGAKVSEGARFCTECGATVGQPPAAPMDAQLYGAPPPINAMPTDTPSYDTPVQPTYPPPTDASSYGAPAQPMYAPPADASSYGAPIQPTYPPPADASPYGAPSQPEHAPPTDIPSYGTSTLPAQEAYAPPVEEPSYGVPVQPGYSPPADTPQYSEPVQPAYAPPADEPSYGAPVQPAYPPADTPLYNEPVQPAYAPPADEPSYGAPVQPTYPPPADMPQYSEPVQQAYTFQPDAPPYGSPVQPVYPPPADRPFYGAPPPPAPPADAAGTKKKSKIWIPIATGIAVIILVIGALWLFTDILPWTDKDNKNANVQTSATARPGDDDDDDKPTTTPSPSPTPTPTVSTTTVTPTPTPTPTPTLNVAVIARSGGDVRADGDTEFEFTPAESGQWEIFTSDNEGDPMLTLFDERGNIIDENDDYDYGLNARIVADLNAGVKYSIKVEFWGDEGTCTLTVSQVPAAVSIPGNGGDVRVDIVTEFEFTPDRSGVWEFTTFDNGDSDPTLSLYDSRDNQIGYDDDSGYDLNAHISTELSAGSTYTIYVGFYSSEASCTLGVTFGLGSGGVTVPSVAIPLPTDVGDVYVYGATVYELIPDQTGAWIFVTSDSGDSDPYLTLYDELENELYYDDDGADDDWNSLMVTFLEAGELYYLEVQFYSSSDYCMLTVIPPVEISGDGGEFNVDRDTAFTFVPNESGVWEFRTSSSGDNDPYIGVLDGFDELLGENDDDAGGLDALLTLELEAGKTYIVFVGFYDDYGQTTLFVTMQ